MRVKFAVKFLKKTQSIRQYSINVPTKPLSIMLLENSNIFIKKQEEKPKMTLDKESLRIHRSIYQKMVEDSTLRSDQELKDVVKRFDKVTDYTGPNREFYPSPMMINTYKALHQNLTTQQIREICTLAWCLEMSTTAMILIDDVLDKEKIRWKRMCWHEKSDIGNTVILDIRQFYSSGPRLLKKYFHDHPSYIRLADLFRDTLTKTFYGQTIDTFVTERIRKTRDFNIISKSTFYSILKYKCSYIMFKNPVLAALYFDNTVNQSLYGKIFDVLDKVAFHFQVKNDLWDCFGKFRSYGKVGTDVREGKCTWMSYKVLDCGSKGQIQLFHENYARESDDECEKIIKNLYRELGIFEMYKQHKMKTQKYVRDRMEGISDQGLRNVVTFLAETYIEAEDDFVE